jgi:hypothetical protein
MSEIENEDRVLRDDISVDGDFSELKMIILEGETVFNYILGAHEKPVTAPPDGD